MTEPLEDVYFNWLCSKVVDVSARSPGLTYSKLFSTLHQKEFVWLITGDDNRAEDGCDLRGEFLNASHLEADHIWLSQPCSVFEMLIALSRRASFETDDSPREWFWIFLTNLGINEYNDASDDPRPLVDDILHQFVWRTYNPNGNGGLFPLKYTQNDQRQVELWYQLSEFIFEHEE